MEPKSPDQTTTSGASWADRATTIAVAYKWQITAILTVTIALLAESQVGLPTWESIPREVKIAAVYAPATAVVSYIPAKAVVDRFLTNDKVRVNEIDAGRGGDEDPRKMGVARSWDVPPGIWEDRETIEGAAYLNFDNEYNVQRLEWDGETLEIWGPWKGEMDDVELETYYHALSETQGRQRFWMQAGKALKMRLPSWLRSMEQSITERVTRMTMDMSTDSLEIYQDEVVEKAQSMTDSVEVPEGYYSAEFAEEVEEEIENRVDEATGGAMSEINNQEEVEQ
jgi:hypothetical protein